MTAQNIKAEAEGYVALCAPAAATVQVLLLTPTCHVSWCPWQVINALV
jgi:hypothetical protein